MNISRQLYWLCCLFDIMMGALVGSNQDKKSLNLTSDKLGQGRTITDIFLKKKTPLLELKINNILRDKYTHPINKDNSKFVLADIMKNSVNNETSIVNIKYEAKVSYQSTNDQYDHDMFEENSTVHTEGYFFNLSGILPRFTRDLLHDPVALNSTYTEIINTSIGDRNYSYIYDNSTTTEPSALVEGYRHITLQTGLNSNNQSSLLLENKFLTTIPSTVMKITKDKENKTKGELNQKQFKKPSISVKSKTSNYSNANATTEINNIKNLTKFSNEISNESLSDKYTNIDSSITENKSNSITTSSLQTLPDSEGLQQWNVFLIGLAVVAIVFTIPTIGIFSVILYRRYHWNKPQTFSDKCSNADSTGYIDDTIKENSEEMYSLDNDSFLNSLEAMTIQNYWADSIRHTKL